MNQLYQHLKKRNSRGIPYDDAVQLFIWVFSTTDVLPLHLRHIAIEKEILIDTFERLTSNGLISPPLSDTGLRRDDVVTWEGLVNAFLMGKIELDTTFPKRSHWYL